MNDTVRETLYAPVALPEQIGFTDIEHRTHLLNQPDTDSTTIYLPAYRSARSTA